MLADRLALLCIQLDSQYYRSTQTCYCKSGSGAILDTERLPNLWSIISIYLSLEGDGTVGRQKHRSESDESGTNEFTRQPAIGNCLFLWIKIYHPMR